MNGCYCTLCYWMYLQQFSFITFLSDSSRIDLNQWDTFTMTFICSTATNKMGSNRFFKSVILSTHTPLRLNSNSNRSKPSSLSPTHRYVVSSLSHTIFVRLKISPLSWLAIALSFASLRLLSSPSFWKCAEYPFGSLLPPGVVHHHMDFTPLCIEYLLSPSICMFPIKSSEIPRSPPRRISPRPLYPPHSPGSRWPIGTVRSPAPFFKSFRQKIAVRSDAKTPAILDTTLPACSCWERPEIRDMDADETP